MRPRGSVILSRTALLLFRCTAMMFFWTVVSSPFRTALSITTTTPAWSRSSATEGARSTFANNRTEPLQSGAPFHRNLTGTEVSACTETETFRLQGQSVPSATLICAERPGIQRPATIEPLRRVGHSLNSQVRDSTLRIKRASVLRLTGRRAIAALGDTAAEISSREHFDVVVSLSKLRPPKARENFSFGR